MKKEIRYIELSKTIKEKYSFLAQTLMPVTLVDDPSKETFKVKNEGPQWGLADFVCS